MPPCGTCTVRYPATGQTAAGPVGMRATKLQTSRIAFTSVDGGSLTHVRDAYPRNGLGNQATLATVGGPTYAAAFTPPSFGFEGEVASFEGGLINNAGVELCRFTAEFQVAA